MIARPSHLMLALSGTAALVLLTLSGVFQAQAAQVGSDTGPSTTKAEAPQSSYLEPLNADESAAILGRKVVGPKGEDLGLITDVIVDRDGKPRAAVIDFGGFLGVGSRKVAVDWNLLEFDPEQHDHTVGLALDRHEIQNAPEYKTNAASAKMVGPPWMRPPSRVAGEE
jgi:hypothetical protein